MTTCSWRPSRSICTPITRNSTLCGRISVADVLFDRALELVMDAGQTLLENGGEVFRAQQTMEIMAASLGVRDFHVYVLTNGIFASAHLPGRDAVSLVRHVPTVSIHLGRVEAVNELSRELAAGRLGVVEAEARLNTARTLPRSTPQLEILACVVGAAGFAYLFGGTLADMPVAAVAGLLEALVCQQFARHGINRIFTDIVAAFCGTIWAIAVQTVVPTVNANAAIIGALMVLTPGVALTMGVRDILNGDYLSGSIRLLDALLIAGSIAGGVVLGWIMARGLGVA
ncbi:MAG TPA: threonine/serine exporter [Subdoligranulum sp.]|nr:threonine/serine exporter [Subdoligranulum sp.]